MTGKEVLEKVQEAKKTLDAFNCCLAGYRVEEGMSPQLRCLYAKMGKLDAALEGTLLLADLSLEAANLPNCFPTFHTEKK